MSGFSLEWLALREGADHAARSRVVEGAAREYFGGRDRIKIVDLACGAGSNLRALAPVLGVQAQHWRLVDHDPALLGAARETLAMWADRSFEQSGTLILEKNDLLIEVHFIEADLSGSVDALFAAGTDLVTSAAFFDLVSVDWTERFVAAIAARDLPLFAALTYTGEEIWQPPYAADKSVLEAFLRHQQSDKGFGPAAGPRGFAALTDALEKNHYRTVSGSSAWTLGVEDRALVRALAAGIAAAAAETQSVPAAIVADWRAARQNASCEIGHADLFAVPLPQTSA